VKNSLNMTSKMEVEVEKCGVPVGPVSTGSVSVSLHPLVIMNISEHWTRVSAQEGKPTQGNIVCTVQGLAVGCKIPHIFVFCSRQVLIDCYTFSSIEVS